MLVWLMEPSICSIIKRSTTTNRVTSPLYFCFHLERPTKDEKKITTTTATTTATNTCNQ